ncbi:MAG: hypothetical protein NVSMB5_10680 [Candidatus Velthaea sp.]
MLRVAFLDQSGDVAGGAERTLATFLRYRPADIEPVVVLFERGAFHDELRGAGIEVRVVDVAEALVRSKRERVRAAGVLAVPAAAYAIARLLRRERIDVLYTNSMKAHFVGAVAARLAGVPCLMHFHDLVEGKALQALRLVARAGSRRRIACSRTVAEWIGLPNTAPVYGPVELEAYVDLPTRAEARRRLGVTGDEPVVAIVGRINRWKGHDRFLRIAARVVAQTPVHFLIVGSPIFRDTDFLDELKETVASLKLENSVRFISWLDDVRDAYAAIDLNVNCSSREPFGRAIPEAAAAGVATVLFDDSGAAETVLAGINGTVVPAGDEARFAAAILDAVGPGARPFDPERVRASARRFDATQIALEMATIIRATPAGRA